MPQGRTWRTTNDNTRSYFYRSFFCRRNRRCKRGKHAHNAHSAGAYHRILLLLIETGSDRTKIRVLKSAIAKNNTVHEAPAEEAPAKKKKGDKPAEIK